MKLLARPKGRSIPLILAAAVLISTSPMVTGCSRGDDQPAAAPSSAAQPSVATTAVPAVPAPATAVEPGPPPGAATAQELQELVSPIALYPDVLVAQLGEAYYNQPADVMNAIQVLRNMAVNAGTLKSTSQQKVEVQPAPPAAQGGAIRFPLSKGVCLFGGAPGCAVRVD